MILQGDPLHGFTILSREKGTNNRIELIELINRITLYNMYLTIVLNKNKSLSTWESPHMSYKAVKTAKICSRIAPVPTSLSLLPLFAAELRGSETECFKSLSRRATPSLFRSLQ